MIDKIVRGDVCLADLSPVVGSEQGGKRPVLIVQNDVGNHFSKVRILEKITTVDNDFMKIIDAGLKVSLGLE